MSYMDHNAALVPAGGIQELSFDEIEQVNGAGRNLTAKEVGVVTGTVGIVATVVGGVTIAVAASPVVVAVGVGAALVGLASGSLSLGATLAGK